MKILCKCGTVIRDQTDYLPHKAYVIGDKDYFEFLDLVDAAILSKDENRERLLENVRGAEPSRLAWECNSCGRLFFDAKDGKLVEYLPQNSKANRIFDRPGKPPIQ
ncbi:MULTISPECIES: hypothetical protein [unclassified Ruegeria]|uniref:hypothetical protein n=1 Tax=unclassified Ruegeria TaxID=2625375 RepID=UPI001487ED23|nr:MULTISPECIES: hypothetical protein [unclassified Ruegeria]